MNLGKFNTFLNYNANNRIYDIALFDKYIKELSFKLKCEELRKHRLSKLNKLLDEKE